MLARTGPLPRSGEYAFEVKWDGFRALVSTESGLDVRSRHGWSMAELVPELTGLTSTSGRIDPRTAHAIGPRTEPAAETPHAQVRPARRAGRYWTMNDASPTREPNVTVTPRCVLSASSSVAPRTVSVYGVNAVRRSRCPRLSDVNSYAHYIAAPSGRRRRPLRIRASLCARRAPPIGRSLGRDQRRGAGGGGRRVWRSYGTERSQASAIGWKRHRRKRASQEQEPMTKCEDAFCTPTTSRLAWWTSFPTRHAPRVLDPLLHLRSVCLLRCPHLDVAARYA